jgi:uncharacterized paraquat-inducible protein A
MRDVRDEFDDDLDPEGPDAADLERFSDPFLMCPECGKAMYDQASVCPHCGALVESRAKMPVWAVAAAIVVLMMLVWLLL